MFGPSPSHKAILFIFTVIIGLVLSPHSSIGDSTGSQVSIDSCSSDQICRDLANTGRALAEVKLFDDALKHYEAAYGRKQAPWLLVQIGRMHQKRLRHQDALNCYEKYLSSPNVASDLEYYPVALKYRSQVIEELERASKKTSPAEQPGHVPVYKKWWFWTALIGSAAIIGAVGVGLGIGLRPHSTQIPDGVPVYEITF